jgi:hypothetical protein
LTLIAVVAVFVLPLALAWWFAIASPESAPRARLNRGTLLAPPLALAGDAALAPLAALSLAPSEWALVYYQAACDDSCRAKLRMLEAIREVSGQAATRVHIAGVVDVDGAQSRPSPRLIVDAEARAALEREVSARSGLALPAAIILLDWRQQVVLAFAPSAPPADIKADLKRLLRASAIR